MATGVFAHNFYRTKTLRTLIKKNVLKASEYFEPSIHNVVSARADIVKIWARMALW